MTRRTKKEHKVMRFISTILWLATIAAIGYFTYGAYKSNMIPTKYYFAIGGIVIFLIIIYFLFVSNKRTKIWIFILNDLLFIALLFGCYFGYGKLHDVVIFINENLDARYETNIYLFLVNKESQFQKLEDLKGKKITLIDDIENKEELERNIGKKIEVEYNYVDVISTALYDLETNKDLILFVNSGNYDAMLEDNPEYESKTKVLDNLEIKIRLENEETGLDITEDPFVLYLTGIDTRSNSLPAKSLSDVNLLVIINPNTKKILMVNTPRDFYVKIHGTSGYDKLTHAGLTGGLKTSLGTIQDLYGIKVNYYMRVNFNALIKLVDAIDGITIYNDKKSTIKCWTDPYCKIKPGYNDVDGRCALAFARERKAYTQGDRHRGENQEQVLTKIIEKASNSKTILTKSSDILKSLEGTFETNLKPEEITNIIKMQLDKMPKWEISTYNVSGTDDYRETRSYPGRELYVMVPDQKTIKKAKEKINKMLEKDSEEKKDK